jgi:hypothetical protein
MEYTSRQSVKALLVKHGNRVRIQMWCQLQQLHQLSLSPSSLPGNHAHSDNAKMALQVDPNDRWDHLDHYIGHIVDILPILVVHRQHGSFLSKAERCMQSIIATFARVQFPLTKSKVSNGD